LEDDPGSLLTGDVEGIGAKAKGRDLQVSDYIGGDRAHRRQRSPDIMVFACRWKRKSFDFYNGLLAQYKGTASRPSSAGLPRGDATQGNPGKEYETHFAQWM